MARVSNDVAERFLELCPPDAEGERAITDLGAFFDPESQPIALNLIRNLQIDVVLTVAGPQPADARDLASIAEHLGRSNCELLGTIENRTSSSDSA